MIKKPGVVMVRVWDPIIRIGHWLIVGGFFIAYVLEEDNLVVHVWAGYVVGAVVLIRLLWGFVGPENARFSSFLYKPRQILNYLMDLPRRRSRRYLGHSPAGGAMILVLILGLSTITASGLMVYAYEENAGPMSVFIDSDQAADSSPGHQQFEESEEFWEELHELAANLTLALVLFHVLGVFLASRIHGENLILAMFNGKKKVGPPE